MAPIGETLKANSSKTRPYTTSAPLSNLPRTPEIYHQNGNADQVRVYAVSAQIFLLVTRRLSVAVARVE